MLEECLLFPLKHVLYPQGVLPLTVYKDHELSLITNSIKTKQRLVTSLITEEQAINNSHIPYNIGTIAKIVNFNSHQNGLLTLYFCGQERVRIHYYDQDNGQLVGHVKKLSSTKDNIPPEYAFLVTDLKQRFNRKGMNAYKQRYQTRDWQSVEWVSCRLSELLPLSSDQHYKLLALDPYERLNLLKKMIINSSWV
ncbi:MAG: LON peptidase substrate-binding domain-containing protein [Cocleimonas sp.]|nr:LON peptidase substrate-binding domain-containing protein [Cocleimonas sp.]